MKKYHRSNHFYFLYLCILLCLYPLHAHSAKLLGIQINEIDQSTHIAFSFDLLPQYKTLILNNPPRFVVDLFDTVRGKTRLSPDMQNAFIKNIRTAPKEGGHYRVVFDLVAGIQDTSLQILPGGTSRLIFKLNYPSWFSNQPRTLEQAGKPRPAATNIVKQIDITQLRDAIVMIDPGHGGKDPGAIGVSKSQEKNIVLATAIILHRILNQEYGITALLTRDQDHFIDLRKRLNIARNQRADLFISLHADSFHHHHVRGASVYVLSDKGASSEAARILAQRENEAVIGGINLDDKDGSIASILLDLSQTAAIGRANVLGSYILSAFGRNTRGKRIEAAGFMVLKSPDIPSVLVELGYLTNPEEEKLLQQPFYQTQLAKNIVLGIKRYLNDYATSNMTLAHITIQDYTVTKGDSLYAIAKRFNTHIPAIKKLSGINSNTIHVGQVLKVPRRK